MRRVWGVWAFALAIAVAGSTAGFSSTPLPPAALCAEGKAETLDDCQQNVAEEQRAAGVPLADVTSIAAGAEGSPEKKAHDEAMADLEQRLLSKLPPDIAALPGSSAALEDFLAKLRISASTVELGDTGKTALAVELTDFLGLSTDHGYKAQAVLRPAAVLPALVKKLSAEDAAAAAEKLGDFDDVLATLSFTPTTVKLGRSLAPHQQLFNALMTSASSAEFRRLASEQEDIFKSPGIPEDFDGDFADVPVSLREKLRATTEAMWRAKFKAIGETAASLREEGFFLLADLAANQPQFVLNVSRSFRDELVGSEETTAKLSYELGWVNINGFRRSCKGAPDINCLSTYLSPDRRAQLASANKGSRLTVSLDYTHAQETHPAFAGQRVDLDGKRRFTGTVAFGRNLQVLPDGTITRRVDLTGSYEDWTDDEAHQDRGVVKLNFTQRLSEDVSATIGAVWATKPEFRGDVDHEVSARMGLTYSIDKKKKVGAN